MFSCIKESKSSSVTLQCNNEGIIGNVVSNRHNAGELFEQITQIPNNTTEITLIGHSAEYYLRSDRNLSSLNPETLANNISKLYKGNKTKVLDFRLVSCEVGLVINGKSFTEQFAKKMTELGFVNLTVHAFNPPNLAIPATGMRVAIYNNNAMPVTMTDAWVYRRQSDERRDTAISTQISNIETQMLNTRAQAILQNLQHEKDQLLEEQSKLRLYVCANADLQTALHLPQNTFNNKTFQAKATMTLDVALAITCLRYKRLERDTQTNRALCIYLDGCLSSLQRHPNFNQQEIQNQLKKKIPVATLDLTMYTQTITDVDTFINNNRELAPEPSIVNASMNTWQMIQKFFAIFIYTCFNGNAPEDFRTKLNDVQQKFRNFRASRSQNQELQEQTQKSLKDLKNFLLNQIQEYLNSTKQYTDKMHLKKKEVMRDLQVILNEQDLQKAKKKLEALNAKIATDKFRCWNKGLASQVAAAKLETEAYIEEIQTHMRNNK